MEDGFTCYSKLVYMVRGGAESSQLSHYELARMRNLKMIVCSTADPYDVGPAVGE